MHAAPSLHDDDAPTNVFRPRARDPERLGEWLVRRGLIDRTGLFLALNACFRHRCCLGDALVWLELIDRPRLEIEARMFEAFRARASARA